MYTPNSFQEDALATTSYLGTYIELHKWTTIQTIRLTTSYKTDVLILFTIYHDYSRACSTFLDCVTNRRTSACYFYERDSPHNQFCSALPRTCIEYMLQILPVNFVFPTHTHTHTSAVTAVAIEGWLAKIELRLNFISWREISSTLHVNRFNQCSPWITSFMTRIYRRKWDGALNMDVLCTWQKMWVDKRYQIMDGWKRVAGMSAHQKWDLTHFTRS